MALFLLAYLGGVLTIVSPCILPVLPFVFARADRPFLSNGLPLLVGMAAAFSAVATLAAVGGGWAVQANQYGRVAAMALLGLFGVTLLFPLLSDRLTTPLVALGSRLSQSANRSAAGGGAAIVPSLLLGVATGLLWAPCAGPLLGLILTGAALQGANARTSLLLLAYAAGAATSLALALLVGRRVFAAMKRSLRATEWIRRGLGVAVLAAVLAIALGLDSGFLTRVSLASTTSVEQRLLDRWQQSAPVAMKPSSPDAMTGGAAMTGGSAMMMRATPGAGEKKALAVEGQMPSLSGAVEWLNSPPLSAAALKGKVVLVDFWTYSCINCLRAIPYVRAWADKYSQQGLVVIGVHAPEFAFEKNLDNVRKAVADLQITYPVAVDNDYAVWRAFDNQYWPAHYFVDALGRIRHHHFGEGGYDESERVIQQLIAEAGKTTVASDVVSVHAAGVQAPSAEADVLSPETYVGYDRAERFVSPGGAAQDKRRTYAGGSPRLNEWGLSGDWTIGREHATLDRSGGSILYRFHARDVHLVLGAAAAGKAIRFRVTIDGAAPGDDRGIDVDPNGQGTVNGQRLYQLIRQHGAVTEHTFEITFLDPGVEAYAFTFG
jgi:cytochrome c biogenesis protein CcdA/thiol-disulfide isomerase/thioredoxin